ncbi:type II toxin-antitoxin system PemK/MazF family toxin [Escherichia coli]|uniref:type II toxin-antitoxin system PemK/MazF family toxin n=1 Tax=Enterobacteriaceae TaxID=543 RepID=UPI0003EF4BC9|nr:MULTISPECIES: type II toxin-antitoxin system PemK/MazF family toxin [Enterobacteriaceae]HDQ6727984.1 type II toxin-antitoxin system PemK/MazF family toxin [Escherichia coli O11:H5]EHX7971864.1 type II toxin-antitoxin system PemK/MazF family toxin [Escherichia coli]EHX8471343.1 type II toxin-antitoxin system PemK/MazF family toxin [Escherichia coli]EKG7998319.1 type II toxin-antitoxin system PemK/MazF family toxin [Escherichia coli]MCQ1664253.1 type II toxin-antitoxin system PemK/MazF family
MATNTKNYTPLPEPGDIVWCYFPQVPGEPGPKPRPSLVVKVAEEDNAVMVVYGTSQKTDRIYGTEFVIRTVDAGFAISGLAHDTKFDMSTLIKLPYNSDWFNLAPMKSGEAPTSPVMGALHPAYIPALKLAHQKVNKAA